MNALNSNRLDQALLRYWMPALIAGILALIAFVFIGQTPIPRALGMAASITGMALMLRRFDPLLAILGSLSLAFSPAFWLQTGAGETTTAALLGIGLLIGVGLIILLIWFAHVPPSLITLLIIFAAVIVSLLIGAPRSLRVTTLISTWLLYILSDTILTANPRPESGVVQQPDRQHLLSMLVLLTVGVVNDPLFILLAPATILGIGLSGLKPPSWYWVALLAVIIIGVRGTIIQYVDTDWWLFPAQSAEALGLRVPYIISGGWREASRWLYLINLIGSQFSGIGLALAVLGLSRLSRWYPPLGVVSMVAFASYALFGLVYYGNNSTILLLPMLIILIIWMTYAIYSLGQWLQKSLSSVPKIQWISSLLYMILPLVLLGRVAGVI